jgi:malic enzyme
MPTKTMATSATWRWPTRPALPRACLAIVADATEAGCLTSRDNPLAVITTGTAVLFLGNIGPLAENR